jgi:hypothetical protein
VSGIGELAAALAAGSARAGLAVDADLRLELTSTAGTTTARVTGNGHRVRVEAERPEVLLAAVSRADVGRAADLLAGAGITVDVRGPHGPVASLGAGTSDRLGRAVTGSRRVAIAPRGAVPLVWAGRRARTSAVVLLVALAVGTAIGRRLRAGR